MPNYLVVRYFGEVVHQTLVSVFSVPLIGHIFTSHENVRPTTFKNRLFTVAVPD